MPNRAAIWRARNTIDHGGLGWEVVERHRRGLTFRHPSQPRTFRMIRSIGEMHTRDGREIDTDLDDDGTLFHSRTLDYGVRLDRGAGRVLTPRPDRPSETVTIGQPQRFASKRWRNVIPAGVERRGHQLVYPTGGGEVILSTLQARVATEVVLDGAAANVPWRWPVSLRGLSWQVEGDGMFSLRSDSDGRTVMWMRPPFWKDSAGFPRVHPEHGGPVSVSFDGKNLTYEPPALPAGAQWPVTIDPDFGVSIAANADDGINGPQGFMPSQTYVAVGYNTIFDFNTWLRFLNVTLPQGAAVSAAHIHMVEAIGSSGTVLTAIWCIDEDDHVAPTNATTWNTDHGIHDTETKTDWDVAAGAAGTAYTTADFSAHAQHVFARANWASGNDLGVHIDDDGTSNGTIYPAARENTTYAEPDLDITYTDPITNTYSWGMQISG